MKSIQFNLWNKSFPRAIGRFGSVNYRWYLSVAEHRYLVINVFETFRVVVFAMLAAQLKMIFSGGNGARVREVLNVCNQLNTSAD